MCGAIRIIFITGLIFMIVVAWISRSTAAFDNDDHCAFRWNAGRSYSQIGPDEYDERAQGVQLWRLRLGGPFLFGSCQFDDGGKNY